MQFYSPNDWLSVYRNDFVPFPNSTRRPYVKSSSEAVFAPYNEYLKVDDCKHAPNEPSETKSEFLKKNPKIADRYFEKPPDDKIICRNYERKLHSLYQRDICYEEDVVQKGKRSSTRPYVQLPDDWQYPTTTHNESYRNPKKLIDLDVRGHGIKFDDKDAFTLSDEMQKIMKIGTGKTIYRKDIDELGKFIIDNAMHGEIKNK